MNVLFVSLDGSSVSLYEKVRHECDPIWHIMSKDHQRVGDGVVWKTDRPDEIASQADLIIFDDNGQGMGELADKYRKLGYVVFGGGTFVDKLEHDRLYGMKVFRDHGIAIPETFEVNGEDEIKAVLRSEFAKAEKLVIKLDGSEFAGSSYSFVAKNPEQCLAQVQHWVDDGALKGKWSGIIQRFVEGIEVSCAAWWNGDSWSTHVLDLEEKKAYPGNLGPALGCAYNTIVRIDGSSRLFKQVLEPLGPLLKKEGYVGEIDTNSIVDADGVPHALEFTPRFGYDSCQTFAWGNNHGFVTKIGMILGLCEPREWGYKGRIWAGVRVHVPPYPAECPDKRMTRDFYEQACLGTPIIDHEKIAEDFYLYDAMRGEDGGLCCSAIVSPLGVAMGAGDDPKSAGLAAYKIAEKINCPNKAFRHLDGWKRAQDALPSLIASKLVRLYPELP